MMGKYIKFFNDITLADLPLVGGKNASLGEMYRNLHTQGIPVPDGFASTATAYWDFIKENNIHNTLSGILDTLDKKTFSNLSETGRELRKIMLDAAFSNEFKKAIVDGYENLKKEYGPEISLAVRSSATAEDLPHASFAGQHESYLNIQGEKELLYAIRLCFSSLFTDRAIKYREDNKFDHMKVALSVGVQLMVRSDKASSGVIFTLDPGTGFRNVVLVTGSWGLGENIVKGSVNPDEFYVFKPALKNGKFPVISHRMGSKDKTLVYSVDELGKSHSPEKKTLNVNTPQELRKQFILKDEEIIQLAKWSLIIEDHYKSPMDIEWAKDGNTGELFIIQARPETVFSRKENYLFKTYTLLDKGNVLCKGTGLGDKIVSGKARIIVSPQDSGKLNSGEILVTNKTDPDWDPIMKKAAAVITNQGGRTSHAAIVARELGVAAVIGTGNAMEVIRDGMDITVSCAGGGTGTVYEGLLKWKEQETDIRSVQKPETNIMLILADPEKAFGLSFLPNNGVGLMRMEFIINNSIRIHPMALKHYSQVTDAAVKKQIEEITSGYKNKEDFFVHRLSEATATIAAAFYPKDVIVRMSDFKSNEYANLIGGKQFEPADEANPMIGFRGASRYYHPLYQEAFEMECKAMKRAREEMGLNNIKLMIPFCRTLEEAKKVSGIMEKNGLIRGKDGLELYMMVEIPSNVILAEEFAAYFDGFSIGSNDLTQLTLGADRDSELLSEIFNPFDPAVKKMIAMAIEKAKKKDVKIGLCGQAPSDYPEFARFLVECGIDSISFNPDALLKGMSTIFQAEKTGKVVSAET